MEYLFLVVVLGAGALVLAPDEIGDAAGRLVAAYRRAAGLNL